VVDEAGKPIPVFEAKLRSSGWEDGRGGLVGWHPDPQLAAAADVVVRADGYAPALARFIKQRDNPKHGERTITMKRGKNVELRFRLPEGLTWPKGLLPEAYFSDYEDSVQMMRQPANRKSYRELGSLPDFNMLNLREAGAGRLAFNLTPDTPPFHVAIHAPGFLQHFETGPFTLADFKDGILEIEVPRPASVDIHFDPAVTKPEEALFKAVSLEVLWQIHGDSCLEVATEAFPRLAAEMKLTDLAPGVYFVAVRTQAKADGAEINPGVYCERKTLVLKAGKSECVDFRWTPFDPDAFRGKRTAVLHVRMPDGAPAKGRRLTVGWYDGHYGYLPVFSGTIPDSGDVTIEGITDRAVGPRPDCLYSVTVDDKRVGHFSFTNGQTAQEFDFHLAPGAGDLAPDVDLINLATGKALRLSSLRGKVVCLEFWATWCGPCQPAMAKLNEWNGEQNAAWKDRVAIVPVSIDASRDKSGGIDLKSRIEGELK
jgi:hypothetical protein